MTMRSVDTRFWEDGWVRKLNALDRYVFLYFLTNTHTNWCGVYELDMAMMAFESGIDKEDLSRSILPRLSPKVIYLDGWVYIPNFKKYHANSTESTKIGYERAFAQVPEEIRLKIKEIELQGVVPPTHPSSAFASAFPLPKGETEFRVEIVSEKEGRPPKEKADTAYRVVFELWGDYPLSWKANRTEITAAKNLLVESDLDTMKSALAFYEKHKDREFCPSILKPSDLDRKWDNLLAFKKKI